jgi:hypothetical protein
MWVLGPGEGDVWRGLAERDVWRDCSDAETNLLVALYERGLAKLTWDRGIK